MRVLAGPFLALALVVPVAAQPINTGHLEAELVAASDGVAPGGTVQVALRQKIQEHWHTYWRNPGDSGQSTKLTWSLPAGWSASGFVWAAPKRLPFGPLVNYGYEGEVLLPVTLTAPPDAKPGQTVELKARAEFLVCADVCIPESADLKLSLPVVAEPKQDLKWGPPIANTLANMPKAAGLTATFQKTGEALKLAVSGGPLKGEAISDAYFFPYGNTVIDHAKPQAVDRGASGVTLTMAAGYAWQDAKPPQTVDGVLEVSGQVYEVTATSGPLAAAAQGMGPPAAAGQAGGGIQLGGAFVSAFLGGLILNLMPCVFPILAMKAASLAGHAHERSAARGQGLAFGAGVLVTFLALAGLLIVLKQAGSAVGWGFQLQSPPVVAALAMLLLLVALNLSGVFEIGMSLQNAGTGLASKGGLSGAFFTGTLAVVVAAPCTAPFMGPAVGWALTQPPVAALTVFLGLGLGFAAPFVAVTFAPGLLARLPRPGPWMDTFKKLMAFPMYAAAAWLIWVVAQQADAVVLGRVLAGCIVLALAAWLYGAAQRQQASGKRGLVSGVLAAALVLVAVPTAVWPHSEPKVASEPYSAERLAALQGEGRTVFVNYTAAWCVSCQVNDRVALSTVTVARAFEKNNAAYLKADWTKKDDLIAADLAKHGRAGVPLYLVYDKTGATKVLPNLLTEGIVIRALEDAAKPS
jgi:thiol:disulfide interchange protein DsbD